MDESYRHRYASSSAAAGSSSRSSAAAAYTSSVYPSSHGHHGHGGVSSSLVTVPATSPTSTTLLSMLDSDRSVELLREHSKQVRLMKDELTRKDAMLGSLRQQVIDLTATGGAGHRVQYELFEQQHRLREDELHRSISELRNALTSAGDIESQLRAQVTAIQRDKLQADRNYTVGMGDMEARLAELRADIERRELQRKKMEFEVNVARRDADRHKAVADELDQSQLAIQSQIEDKVRGLKRDRAMTDQTIANLMANTEAQAREIKDLRDAIALRDVDIRVQQKSKEAHESLVETVHRELRDLQEQNAALKVSAALVPELRRELDGMTDIRTQLRDSLLHLQESQARVRNNSSHTKAIEEENQRLHELNRELENHLKSLRDRYAEFTAPGSELERAKQNADLSHAEAERFRAQMRKQQHELDHIHEKNTSLESRIDTTQNEIVVELSNLNRVVESVMAGGDVDEKASVVSSSLLLHADTVRNVIIGLRASTVASLTEMVTLRSHKHQLAGDLDAANTILVDTRHQLNDVKQQLMIEERRARDVDELRASQAAIQQRLLRTQSELEERTRFVAQIISEQLVTLVDVLRQYERSHTSNSNGAQTANSERERDNPLLLTSATSPIAHRDRDTLNRSSASLSSSTFGGAATSRAAATSNAASGRHRRDSDASVNLSMSAGRTSTATDNRADDAWIALRDSVADMLHITQTRLRGILVDNDDMTRRLTSATDTIRRGEEALRSVSDEWRQKHAATVEDANQRLQSLDHDRNQTKKLLQQSQADEHKQVMIVAQLKKEVTDLNEAISQLNAACRLMYRGYQPLRERTQDLSWQKSYLHTQNQKLYRLQKDVYDLMYAMTGELTTRDGSNGSGAGVHQVSLTRNKTSLRAAIIAVIAARRFIRRDQRMYGQPVRLSHMCKIHGETINLMSLRYVNTNDSIPECDQSTLSLSGQSFIRLTHHFQHDDDKDSIGIRNDLLADLSLGYYRHRAKRIRAAAATTSSDSKLLGHGGGMNDSSDDGDTVDTIRKLALTWATRVRDLERDYRTSTKDARRLKSELDREQKRVTNSEDAHRQADGTITALQDRVQQLETQMTHMIDITKYDTLRHELDANTEKQHVLEQHKELLERDLQEAQRLLRDAARTADSLHGTVDSLQRANQDKHEELGEVKTYMIRTTKELQTLDIQVKDRESQLRVAQSSLDACERKHKTILNRLREVETEADEHRNTIHRLQSQLMTYDTATQQQEAQRMALVQELTEKDKELAKVQAMYKALAQAHRIATTHAAELDDELGVYRTQVAHLRGRAPSSSSMPLSPLKALIDKQAASPADISFGDVDHLTVPRSKASSSTGISLAASNGNTTHTADTSTLVDERLGEGVERRLQQAMDRAYASTDKEAKSNGVPRSSSSNNGITAGRRAGAALPSRASGTTPIRSSSSNGISNGHDGTARSLSESFSRSLLED